MMIIPYVCADFYDRNRNLIHRITPADLGKFNYPPESIKEDPLYQMLVNDGSIRTPEEKSEQRALENDPYAGITAEGREIGAASGGYDADFEVNRNKRSVRGTVAPIEVAEQAEKPKAEKPKAETKSRTTAKAPAKAEAKGDEKPADNPMENK